MTISGQAVKVASSSATAKVAPQAEQEALELARILEYSKALATGIDRSVGRRKAIPIRNSFVRNDDPAENAPLQKLVSGGGGRGAAVPVMLYVALIWKCAKKPFTVSLPARQWAELLALPDPYGKGARRVANALQTLADLQLIKLDRVHGGASKVTLLDESGDGSEYELPSTAYSQGGLKRDLYFKVSGKLWTSGEFQQLSAPALAMLLILLEEGGHKPETNELKKFMHKIPRGKEVWFTTENFPLRYGISASMRSRGTKELENAEILDTHRRPVGPPLAQITFTTEKVRKIYVLQGNAVVENEETEVGTKKPKTSAKKRSPKSVQTARTPKKKT